MNLRKLIVPFIFGVLLTLGIGMLLISTEQVVLISSIKYDRLMTMDKKYEKVEKIKQEILDDFYLEITEDELDTGMYRGLFEATGDKYSRYFTPEELVEYNDSTNGNYVGIGVLSDVGEGDIHITRVFPNSPAEGAGILVGDFIIEVDGEKIEDVGHERLIDIMLGEDGTDIQVIVNRNDDIIVFDLKRGKVEIPFVTSAVIDNIGYLHIYQFGTDASKEFDTQVKELMKEGVDGLIIDVRDNPGGLVTESTNIADELMGKGLIIYTLDNKDNKRTYNSDSGQLDIPMVFLSNERSASASEILLGAIKDTGVGPIVGETTFGKGIVQGITNLTDGSGFKMTYSQYFTPNDQVIHKVGVTPDYIVEYDGNFSSVEPDPAEDIQLKKAMDVIQELILSN